MFARLTALSFLLWCGIAVAHRPSDAFLTLDVRGRELNGQWEIALRDLEVAVGVDANNDDKITWGELKAAEPKLRAALLAALQISADGKPCVLNISDLLVNNRVDGHFAWFTLAGECPSAPVKLGIHYSLLFALDPSHRGILVLTSGGVAQSAVLSPDRNNIQLTLAETSHWRQFWDYLRDGTHHIWIGADHILFLLSLLLPAVLLRNAHTWKPVTRLRDACWEVFGVVTAFTLAHSVTLSLAALQIIRLPTSLTESAIAASVFFAAMNNVFPVVTRARWPVAFGFGLIHGFGFASVLGELGLPQGARLLSLVAFNLGVEVGQLSIVLIAMPVAYLLRYTSFYRRYVMTGGSLLVAGIAAYWFAQRSGLLNL